MVRIIQVLTIIIIFFFFFLSFKGGLFHWLSLKFSPEHRKKILIPEYIQIFQSVAYIHNNYYKSPCKYVQAILKIYWTRRHEG